MNRGNLLRERKHKQRLKRLKLPIPIVYFGDDILLPQPITKDSPASSLSLAYAISIYWDNDLLCFIAELADFDVKVHSSSWDGAAAAAKVVHELLIAGYRQGGYPLPEV